jgi:hypothetical protein
LLVEVEEGGVACEEREGQAVGFGAGDNTKNCSGAMSSPVLDFLDWKTWMDMRA